MKVQVFIVLSHVLLVAYAITVPPVWPKSTPKYQQPPRYYKTHNSRPLRHNSYRNQQPSITLVKNVKHKNIAPQFQTDSHWVPVTSNPVVLNKPVYTSQSYISQSYPFLSPPSLPRRQQSVSHSNRLNNKYNVPKTYQTINYNRLNYVPHADTSVPFSPITNSFIHSVPTYTPTVQQQLILNPEERLPENEVEIKSNYNTPVSEHELPKDIPTKPIYPGEGQWARPGIKHKPYVDTQKYSDLKKDDTKSDGYDVFERGEERFKEAQKKYNFNDKPRNRGRYKLREPTNHKIENESSAESNTDEEKEIAEFVPQKIYAQVRRTETKKHLPRSEIDSEEDENAERLKEIIKDSKIQTVYSEEGYEDTAYDHAGHEKKAESEADHYHKGQGVEKGGRKTLGNKKSRYGNEGGHHRGESKYRRTKNRHELSELANSDSIETYNDIKKQVEQEGKKLTDTESAASENIEKKIPSNVSSQKNSQDNKDMQKIEIKSTMKNGNDVNMEIHTEVKFLNGSDKKKHKFIKIVPSYRETVEADETSNESSEFQETNQEPNQNFKRHRRYKRYDREKLSRMYVRQRPNYYWKKNKTKKIKNISTFSKKLFTTTEIPKIKTTTVSPEIKDKSLGKTRRKRYTIDHPEIEVPFDKFEDVDKIPIPTKRPDLTHIKYPYFKLNTENIHEYSPLRYAQDLKNIPNKQVNQMSFYDSTSNVECTEIEDTIDPVPDRIKNKKEDDDNEEDEEEVHQPETPRLKGLGDKIDCLKLKYFGENPLDSPFFSEKVIEIKVLAIFEKFNNEQKLQSKQDIKIKINPEPQETSPVNDTQTPIKRNDDIHSIKLINATERIKKSIKRDLNSQPIIVLDENLNETVITDNPINEQSGAVLKPPYILNEAEKENNNIKLPNNIYDQLYLLGKIESNEQLSEESQSPKFLIIYKNQNNSAEDNFVEEKIKTLQPITTGYKDPKISDIISDLSNASPVGNEVINLVPGNFTEHDLITPISQQNHSNNNINLASNELNKHRPIYAALVDSKEQLQNPDKTEENLNKSIYLPLIIPINNKNSNLNSTLPSTNRFSPFIFDISKYLPQIKNHKIITSEVQYKDEIKPSEQMNVYSDVLKAINISTQENHYAPSENSQPITVKLQVANNTKKRYPKRRIRIKTTTLAPTKYFIPMKNPPYMNNNNNIKRDVKKNKIPDTEKMTPQVFPEAPVTRKPLPDNIKNMINQYSNSLIINVPDIEYSKESHEFPDLAPPTTKFNYRTIQPAYKSVTKPGNIRQFKTMNTYFVVGLRPPPEKQDSLTYSDYVEPTRKKRNIQNNANDDDLIMDDSEIYETYHPAPKRPMYTEIVRSRPTKTENVEEDEEEEEEDLLPRKRIYNYKSTSTRTTTTEKQNEEEYHLIPETEAPVLAKPKYVQPPVIEKPTGLPDYIKIIDKLHEYRRINNITTTLPEQETTTANPRLTTTTAKVQMVAESSNVQGGEPAYLQIINHLHQLRKNNEDATSTPAAISEEPEEIFSQQEPVQNSNPYIVAEALTSPRYNDDDDDDEEDEVQSHIRNLSSKFRTSIDTSKYKTIERTPILLRHNLSSRYNADDHILPLEKMFTTKMPVVYTTTNKNLDDTSSHERISQPRSDEDEEKSKVMPEIKIEVTVTQSDESDSEEIETATLSTTSTAPRRRTRLRTRPTTTTTKVTEQSTTPTIRRRRPLRTRSSTTTTTESAETTTRNNPLFNRRRIRPKLEPQTSQKNYVSAIPPNHKREYTPVTEISESNLDQIVEGTPRPRDKKKRRLEKLHERRVTSEYTRTRYYNPDQDPEPEARNSDKKSEYEIIGEIQNPEMKHGGNYRHINDASAFDNEQEQDIDNDHKESDLLDRNAPLNSNKLKTHSIERPLDVELTETSEKASTWKPSFTNYHPSINRRLNTDKNDDSDNAHATFKPKIIKDPSKRMYFYAKL